MTIGVVHLVRAANGIAPFRRFLASYLAHPAGAEHELLFLFKGFQQHQLAAYRQLLHGVAYRSLEVADHGYDIAPYLHAARTFEHPSFCFLNSFSEIVADDWLLLLRNQFMRRDVGLVGASGSWESVYTNLLRILEQHWNQGLATRIRSILLVVRYRRLFPPFPNHHIRTNAFLIDAALLRSIRVWPMRTKRDVQRFESGRQSLTKQVQERGLAALVVGRDGVAYQPDDWSRSHTFRQGTQANLLVADNRSRDYACATPNQRTALALAAWGARAAHTGVAC